MQRPDHRPPTLDPASARAIRNAAEMGIDPYRVAVALAVDPDLVAPLLRSAATPSRDAGCDSSAEIPG
jgi:hypothetical protein